MNRTLTEATVRRYYYSSHDELRQHLQTFLVAYNEARRLKTLNGLTPHEYICNCWTQTPDRFRPNPLHHTVGLNTFKRGRALRDFFWSVNVRCCQFAPEIIADVGPTTQGRSCNLRRSAFSVRFVRDHMQYCRLH
jgi:hypothetical protein